MALKGTVSKLEEVPEAVRGEYKPDGAGGYKLDVVGMVLESEVDEVNSRVGEFRTTNISLQKELNTLKQKYEGIDPEEVARLKKEKAEFEKSGVQKPNDIAVMLSEGIQKAVEPLQREIQGLQKREKDAQDTINTRELEDRLWAIGSKTIKESAKVDFLTRGKQIFKLEKGKLVAVDPSDPETQLFSKRRGQAHQPLTPEEWVSEPEWLYKDADHLFKGNTGSDTPRTRKGGDAADGVRVIANDPYVGGQSLNDIATGKVLVAGNAQN